MDGETWSIKVLENESGKKIDKYSQLLDKLSTRAQVTKLSKLIQHDRMEQMSQLEAFMVHSQAAHNKSIRKLELARADLTSTLSHYRSALANITTANLTASKVDIGISSIDKEIKIITKTVEFLENVRSLKNNIMLVHSSLGMNDHITAARAINDIRSLPVNIINSQFANRVVPTSELPELPSVLVDKWCLQLTQIFKDNFIKATHEQNIEQLTTIFKLFPMVGQDSMGLELYSKYICDIIANESRKIMTGDSFINTATLMQKPNFFSQTLLHLFKIVSTVINEHSRIITESYGKSHMVQIMEKVEKEAELQAGLILDTFVETKNLKSILQGIREIEQKHTNSSKAKKENEKLSQAVNDNDDKTDLSIKDLAILIGELSQILQNWSMYIRFYSVKWNEFNGIQDSVLLPPSPISDGVFNAKLQKVSILESFNTLVQHNLKISFDKSVALEELPSLNKLLLSKTSIKHSDISSAPVSSVMEDFLLIIRNNLIMTVNTGQYQVLSRFLDQLVQFVQNEFLVAFVQFKFKTLQPRLSASTVLKKYSPVEQSVHPSSNYISESYAAKKISKLGFNFRGAAANALTNIQSNLQAVVSDEDSVLALHHYLIYINTLCSNIKYSYKVLNQEILEANPTLLQDNFPFDGSSTRLAIKIKECEQMIRRQTEKLEKWSIKYMFDNVIETKVQHLMAEMFINGPDDNYLANADDFEDMSKLHEFATNWNSLIVPFQHVLYEDAMKDLLRFITDSIVKKVEKKVWSIKANELGVTKLDREMSLLISTVCGTNYSLREKFTRLKQIILVLGFDQEDIDAETNDVKEDIANTINWVLNSQDRIKTRQLLVK